MLGKSISKNSVILGGFALITAGVLATTFKATETKIAQAQKRAAQLALLEIVPLERHDNDMLDDTWPIPAKHAQQLGIATGEAIHIARKDGKPVAAIIPSTAPDGYSGAIKIIVGINTDGTIAGARALAHKETPGLGDKIDLNKDEWILGFNNKSLNDPVLAAWKVKKDGGEFDQFTGATITPRAVVNRIKQTLIYFQEHRDLIFAKSNIDEQANTGLPMSVNADESN
ncbi:electron transport complex subunit RsxG [Agarilytica rhodophyticola]|uniref:electron transport complex subunit RsxG n=1 Tax=Agarilytica rhodophyticola TaxID=1737490 RepID=UPI000B3460AC|nr:electron transport complex subunit RsxG [Agarilytica rhodophyticola]